MKDLLKRFDNYLKNLSIQIVGVTLYLLAGGLPFVGSWAIILPFLGLFFGLASLVMGKDTDFYMPKLSSLKIVLLGVALIYLGGGFAHFTPKEESD